MRIAIAVLSIAALIKSNQTAKAAWIDSSTGQPVYTVPFTGELPGTAGDGGLYRSTGKSPSGVSGDPDHAFLPRTGKNLYWDKACGTWKDARTGNEVYTVPFTGELPGTAGAGGLYRSTGKSPSGVSGDPDHAFLPRTGKNLFWQPCPPPQTAASTGLYIGGELVKNWGGVRSTERLTATGVQTNQFSDRADPVGGGFLIGYKFAPWANNIIISPFASFDFLNSPVNHTFPGGSYLGTTANFMGTGGVKIGPQLGAGVGLYGIAGVSVMNGTLNINFIPVSSSRSAWVPGATVGFGGAWQPSFLQGYGHPVSVFAEYQHTWWQSANFNTPGASPLFNYNFARQDDVVKVGFTVSLGASLSAAPTSYPVKAPMLK